MGYAFYNNKNEAIEEKKIKLYKDLRYLESASYSEYDESIKDDKSYKYEASLTDIDIDGDTISIVNIKNLKDYLRNPFNHKSESWKGTEY